MSLDEIYCLLDRVGLTLVPPDFYLVGAEGFWLQSTNTTWNKFCHTSINSITYYFKKEELINILKIYNRQFKI